MTDEELARDGVYRELDRLKAMLQEGRADASYIDDLVEHAEEVGMTEKEIAGIREELLGEGVWPPKTNPPAG